MPYKGLSNQTLMLSNPNFEKKWSNFNMIFKTQFNLWWILLSNVRQQQRISFHLKFNWNIYIAISFQVTRFCQSSRGCVVVAWEIGMGRELGSVLGYGHTSLWRMAKSYNLETYWTVRYTPMRFGFILDGYLISLAGFHLQITNKTNKRLQIRTFLYPSTVKIKFLNLSWFRTSCHIFPLRYSFSERSRE